LNKHTKREIKLDKSVNDELWKRGMKHPPREIRVKISNNIATIVK
jgi:ribosomal protein L31E